MTWWQAAIYAKAGIPVRSAAVLDPLVWFVREVPGLFHTYEEENGSLGSPAPADETHVVVPAAKFTAVEFLAADWTTDGVPAGPVVHPPAIRLPPAIGLPIYPPFGDPPAFPPLVDPPPYRPPPPPSLTHWESLVAVVGSGNSFTCSGILTAMPEASDWICFAEIPLTPPFILGIGSGSGAGNVSCAGSATPPSPVGGLLCTFRASCVRGAGKLRGSIVLGTRIIAVA